MKLQKISKAEIGTAAQFLADYWKSRGMSYSKSWVTKYIKHGHKAEIKREPFFVLKEGKEIVGVFSIVVWEGDVAEIRDLVVKKPSYEAKVLDSIIKWCKQNKVRKIFDLEFSKKTKLFRKFGFVKEGLLRRHFTPKENLIIFSKFLR